MQMSSIGRSLLTAYQPLLGQSARGRAVIEHWRIPTPQIAWGQVRGRRPKQRIAVGERKTRQTNRTTSISIAIVSHAVRILGHLLPVDFISILSRTVAVLVSDAPPTGERLPLGRPKLLEACEKSNVAFLSGDSGPPSS